MFPNNDLPNVGTPEEALAKMKDSYKAFVDVIAKFVTLSEFYTDQNNVGKPLGSDFAQRYQFNFTKIKNSSAEDVAAQIGFFTLLELDFVEDIKDNLVRYNELLSNSEEGVSDYDRACDLLTVKDEFTDEIAIFEDVNKAIASDKEAYTNYNDPAYDPNAKIIEENAEEAEKNGKVAK
jgi:hypothetical protein